jgi:hypothetical protein
VKCGGERRTIDDDKRPDTMKVAASIFLRDADSPTLVDFFQREKRSTFIAPSMKKKAHVKEICWRVRCEVLSKRPRILQRMREAIRQLTLARAATSKKLSLYSIVMRLL